MAACVSAKKATLRECQEYYSVEDLYDILEILAVDTHNRNVFTPK